MTGRVLFPAQRSVAATMQDVATAATVSLINTGSNTTETTTVTDGSGVFVLQFPNGFRPDTTATYYLEAVKGLNTNRPSSSLARVRTLARYQNGGWTTITNGIPGSGIVLNRSTTALAIGAALRQGTATPVDFSALIGTVQVGSTSEQDVYGPVTSLSASDCVTLRGLVTQILTDDQDPVAKVGLNTSTNAWVRITTSGGFTVTGSTPTTGSAGTSVTIAGTGFSSTAASNSITFNGVNAMVSSATSTSLGTTVPSGAVSGQVVVTVDGVNALGPLFTVPVVVSSFTPSSGTAGTSVTITGSGFSATAADNVVLINRVQAMVTSASATSLTVTMPSTTTGRISVHVMGVVGTSGSDFVYASPMLNALYQPVMNANGTLKLEGYFGSSATMNFPGGVSVAATVLGPNRAQVTVPAGATAGNLTVTTGGVTTNAQPFRRANFGLGLNQFAARYDQAGYQRSMPMLARDRMDHSSVVIGDFVYVIGGRNATHERSVERARINSDATLGRFEIIDSMLASPRAGHVSVQIGNYLYVLAGNDAATYINTVERATINSDGTISNFAVVPGLTIPSRSYATSAIIGNYLYLIAGTAPTGTLNTIDRLTISQDGTLSAPLTISSRLVEGRQMHSSLVSGNSLYIFGGYNGTNSIASIERTTLGPDGMLSTFATVGAFNTARYAHTTSVVGNRVYALGGYNTLGVGLVTTIEQADVLGDGSFGSFSSVTGLSMAETKERHTCHLIGDQLYVFGGNFGSWSRVQRASINASGNLGTFSSLSGVSMIAGRGNHSLSVLRNYVYAVGGANNVGGPNVGIASVERASINDDGSLGPFSLVSGVALGTGRLQHSSVVIGNFLYVLGGYNSAVLGSIERAPINADGTIGPFSSVGALAQARSTHTNVVIGNYLYVIGGYPGSGALNSVERAAINSDGSLGAFSTLSGVTLVAGRYGHISAVFGNFLYVLGGYNGTYLTSVERAPINSDGTIGTFATVTGFSLTTARYIPVSATIGGYLYLFGGYNDTNGYLSSVERAAINADGSLGIFSAIAGTLATARYTFTGATFGNHLYLMGGRESTGNFTSNIERAVLQ